MRALTIAFVQVAAVAFLLSPIVYHRRTRGAWRRTPEGWHFMSFMGVMAMVLVLVEWSLFFGPLPAWLRPVTWGSIATVAVWRLVVLIRVRHE